ncbi:relaxase/mobilization nuclease domain-containing protein [Nocardioides aurantiacus]|nr:hypothetical protein [Nocardioides aurantiacus]
MVHASRSPANLEASAAGGQSAARLAERTGEGQGRQVLDDRTWEQIATEFVDEMGFSEQTGKSPCRWAAVHHGFTAQGGDHIHIAVVLVREDGTRASTHNDYRTASAAAARLERKYGLEVVASREVGRSARGLRATGSLGAAKRWPTLGRE